MPDVGSGALDAPMQLLPRSHWCGAAGFGKQSYGAETLRPEMPEARP